MSHGTKAASRRVDISRVGYISHVPIGKSDNASDVSRRHTRSNNCVGLFSSACPNTTNSNCALEISLPFEGDDASLRYNRRQPGSDSSVIATPLNPRWRAVLIIHLNDCCLLFR